LGVFHHHLDLCRARLCGTEEEVLVDKGESPETAETVRRGRGAGLDEDAVTGVVLGGRGALACQPQDALVGDIAVEALRPQVFDPGRQSDA
jgi:hypothetical protein